MYLSLSLSVYTYMYIHIHTYTYIYLYVYVCVHTHNKHNDIIVTLHMNIPRLKACGRPAAEVRRPVRGRHRMTILCYTMILCNILYYKVRHYYSI